MSLQTKIDMAIKLLKSIKADEIEVCFSGGKDSSVILELAKMADIPYRAIYKKTTIDPPGTIKFCRENGVEIKEPKIKFFDLIAQRGFPTRRIRFCCDELKEYKILDNAIIGIRRCESENRKKLYKEPVICRIYGKKSSHVNVILPILYWDDDDVKEFINLRCIKCHPSYYNTDGNFDVKKRLGCLCCPLQSDKGKSDFKRYPNFVKAWINAGQIWWDKQREKEIGSKRRFNNVYELFAHNIFFKTYDDFDIARSGFFGKVDFKERLENYFGIKL